MTLSSIWLLFFHFYFMIFVVSSLYFQGIKVIRYFALHRGRPRLWPKESGKHSPFNVLIQFFLYFPSESNLIVVFQGIISHLDMVIVFWSYAFRA